MPNRERKKITAKAKKNHAILMKALCDLLATTQFEYISVVDICEKAGFTRVTFYNYFKDKHEFFEFCVNQTVAAAFENAENFKPGSPEFFNAVTKFAIAVSKRNEKLTLSFIKALTVGGENAFQCAVSKYFCEKFSETSLNVPVKIFADYCAANLTNLLKWYLTDGKDYSEEEVVGYVRTVFSPTRFFENAA